MSPILTFEDPLPAHDRVGVCGVTGVGKTTLCRTLSAAWDLPYTELDTLHWGPGWTSRPTFAADVAARAATDRWISDLQYLGRGPGWDLVARAELVLWLDFPRRIARLRLLRRTLARQRDHAELWPGTGNVEPPLHTVFRNEDHILRWEARTHAKWRRVYIPQVRERFPGLPIVRFGHPRELRTWLARVA